MIYQKNRTMTIMGEHYVDHHRNETLSHSYGKKPGWIEYGAMQSNRL